MATTNVTITTTWTKVAEDSDSPVTIQHASGGDWEIAAIATDTAPSVDYGHRLCGYGDLATRDTLLAGFLYARALQTNNNVTLVVTK